MQKQYVSNATVNFSDFKIFVRPGDICSHNEVTNDFVIYRNGELIATIKTSVMALKAMMTPETGYFSYVEPSPSSPVVKAPEVIPTDVVVPGDNPNTPEVEDATVHGVGVETRQYEAPPEGVVGVGGMEFVAEKGVTVTLVDLNEEKQPEAIIPPVEAVVPPVEAETAVIPPPEKEVIVAKNPDKIKAIAAKQSGRKPKVVLPEPDEIL